eukprot:TRINITY_DN5183_c0_g1_i3.p1 TRINITY_DN5183_c0_g1~~TRINITY_DN5183_c0_g1_i3.p1  ORF type:complete len:272 (+),score=87.48 TRINITY_DN5183_c0_g1_i3:107-922(+)
MKSMLLKRRLNAGLHAKSHGTTSMASRSANSGKGALTTTAEAKVIYVGRIPHGFYEDQMAEFFGQFGKVTRMRLSRNRRTGKSKHYAFVEFEVPEVAKVVADAMHNYLLFGSMLQVKLVPPADVHPALWKGANRSFKVRPWQKIAMREHNKDRTPEEHKKLVKKLLKSDKIRREKLQAAGIDYSFDGYASCVPPAPKRTKFIDSGEEAEEEEKKAGKDSNVNDTVAEEAKQTTVQAEAEAEAAVEEKVITKTVWKPEMTKKKQKQKQEQSS